MILPSTPLLQLVPPRAQKALDRLQEIIWHDSTPLTVFHAEAGPEHRLYDKAHELPLQKTDGPFHWGKYFDQKWFKLVLPEPSVAGDYLHWPAQGEATAYVDGKPYYGFDLAHTHCPLAVGTREIWIDAVCMETGWIPGAGPVLTAQGCRFAGGFRVRRNDDAWHAYHDLWFLFELAREEHKKYFPPGSPYPGMWGCYLPPIENVSVLYRRLLRGMDEAVDAFDTKGLPAMRAALCETYAALPADSLDMAFVATGHAHIDLVWLWPEHIAEVKALHTFATMNRLMDLYPEFHFGYSQAASYAAAGRRSPAMLENIKARIREGRWEATGAAEVESDTYIACGEALARSLIVGQRRFRELRGEPARTMWLPDVFGYCAALPQILQQTGVTSFFTTKLTWSTVNKFPYSSFIWRGADGSEVLSYVTQDYGYNGTASPAEMRIAALAHRQSDVHPEALAPTGYGDGGGGTTEAMCERVRRAANLAGVPRARWGRIEDFFQRLESRRAKLPVYQGEFYLEYHRGVFTSIGRVKAAYRACERAMQIWESVRVALGCGEIDQQIWQRVIFTQFHDYIPGSSRQEVYDEGIPELQQIAANALQQAAAELADANSANSAPALWNPLPYPRIVWADGAARTIPPLTGAPISELPVVTPSVQWVATPSLLENDRVTAGFDISGRCTSLKIDDRTLALSAPLGELLVFPDYPHACEAWDIDRGTLALGQPAHDGAICESNGIQNGEAFLIFRRTLTAKSSVLIRYSLAAHSPVLRIDYDLDWHDEDTLLKVIFPTAYQGRFARYGTPFGSVLRSQQPGQEHDEAQWEVPGSRYAIVMDDSDTEGLAVITEAKYGFACRSGLLSLSLVRSPLYPCFHDHPTLKRATNLTRCSDLGPHHIRLAVGLHTANRTRAEQPAALTDLLFTDVLPYQGPARSAGFLGLDGGDSLQPCWAKPALDGNGWILRLHETLGRRGITQLRLAENICASLTDLSESLGAAIADGKFAFTPYQLLSIRLTKK